MNSRRLLQDVVLIRPIAVILIVLWHTFIIFQGGWHQPDNYQDIAVYWWIAKTVFIFSLELFVFVSGYVFSYNNITNPKPFGHFFLGKARRLIIPSVVFSILYILFISGDLTNISNFESIFSSESHLFIKVLIGAGHLWFLPMLFIVFIISYFLVRFEIRIVVFFIACLFIIAPVILAVKLPYNISEVVYYLPFFLTGYYFYRFKEQIDKFLLTIFYISLFVFVSAFFISTIIKAGIDDNVLLLGKYNMIARLGVRVLRVVAALGGVIFSYSFANLYIKKHETAPILFTKMNSYCFGIYIFQQFIIQILYFKTSLFQMVGSYYAPWITLVITLFFSYLLTYLLRLFKYGRLLIG